MTRMKTDSLRGWVRSIMARCLFLSVFDPWLTPFTPVRSGRWRDGAAMRVSFEQMPQENTNHGLHG